MIDMHCHCLPFVDDGADSVETSLAMLEEAKKNGADIVVATPHCVLGRQDMEAFLQIRNESYNAIREIINKDSQRYPKLLTGAEVFLGSDISEFEDLKMLCYEGTDYILLELSPSVSCSLLSEWIYNISIAGLKPVIAHIDRFENYKQMKLELKGIDVVYQINAARFFGIFSRFAVKGIVEDHDKFIVSSDMHNLTTRKFNMHQAKKCAEKFVPQMCDMMFHTGAANMLFNNNF